MRRNIELLLKKKPYGLGLKEKRKIFLKAFSEAAQFHYSNNLYFRNLSLQYGFDPFKNFVLEEAPFVPVTYFKKSLTLSVPRKDVDVIISSSATKEGKPSLIGLDETTSKRQAIALKKIISDLLGNKRRHFAILDNKNVIDKENGKLISRGVAIRGFLPFMKSMNFFLDSELNFLESDFKSFLENTKEPCALFGFTWVVFNAINSLKDSIVFRNKDTIFLHIGGWKKLQDKGISKKTFNDLIKKRLGILKIYDIYGMTEQLGTIYPDCPRGHKHSCSYSEVIIRDLRTLKALGKRKKGFIQLLSPLPHSYPGISLLTEDIGEIIGVDDCPCGRKGTYFVFHKRASDAEIKGCGDTFAI